MIYLSIILTIICLILLSFLIGAVVLIKKYGGKMSNFTKKIGNDTKSKSKCFESGASFLSVFGRSFKK